MTNLKDVPKMITNSVCEALENMYPAWECRILMLGEPKMPAELIMEDAE